MKKVLVLGAGGSAGINFVASLRIAPEKVYIVGCDINKWHLELPDLDVRYIVPRCSEPNYLNAIRAIANEHEIGFIHAQPDVEVEFLSEHRDEVPVKTVLPSIEAIRICRDKFKTNRTLEKAKVPAARSYLINNINDISDILKKLIHGKLDRAWIRAVKGAGSRAALPVKTSRQAREWIHYWRTMRSLESKDFMLCEYLPGKEFAFQSLWKDGDLIVSQARERLEYLFGNLSPSGQSSSPSVAVTRNRDDVNDIATRAIKAVDRRPHGVFCVDMKENMDGVPCITEINAGRFFTTSNFFSELGINMPDLLLKIAYQEKLPKLPKYNAIPEGHFWIRLMDKGPVHVVEGQWRSNQVKI